MENDPKALAEGQDELMRLGLMFEIKRDGKSYIGLNSKGKALGFLLMAWIDRDLEVLGID